MKEHERLLKKRWWLLAVICLINLCLGSIYAWSVLSAAAAEWLTQTTGVVLSAGDLAIAFGLANGLAPLPMILGGASWSALCRALWWSFRWGRHGSVRANEYSDRDHSGLWCDLWTWTRAHLWRGD